MFHGVLYYPFFPEHYMEKLMWQLFWLFDAILHGQEDIVTIPTTMTFIRIKQYSTYQNGRYETRSRLTLWMISAEWMYCKEKN